MWSKLAKIAAALAAFIGLGLALLEISRNTKRAAKAEARASELAHSDGRRKLKGAMAHAKKRDQAVEKTHAARDKALKNMDIIGGSNESHADLLSEWNAGDRLRHD